MAIAKWTKVDQLTIRHDPSGVTIVKEPAHVEYGRQGAARRWTQLTQIEAKARAERYTIPMAMGLRETAHAEALAEDAYRTELAAELKKFAEGAAPYPYVRVNDGEPQARIVDIETAHAEAIEMDGRIRERAAAEHFRQAVVATIPTDGLGMDILHSEALAEDKARGDAVPSAVVAPQLHPEDTTRWDPQRRLAGVDPSPDHHLVYAVNSAMQGYQVPAAELRGILARLRRAELALARANADLVRRDAEQVLRLARRTPAAR